MRKAVLNLSVAFAAAFVAVGASRPIPEYLKNAVVYQIVLHNFTQTGTFKAARAMLDHVRSTGADVVYLTPFFEMDRDMDRKYWCPRQIGSGYDSPRIHTVIRPFTSCRPLWDLSSLRMNRSAFRPQANAALARRRTAWSGLSSSRRHTLIPSPISRRASDT